MAAFLNTGTKQPFYCLELSPKINGAKVRFLDSTDTYDLTLSRKGSQSFELSKGSKSRSFQIVPGGMDNRHLNLHFDDSSLFNPKPGSSYDGGLEQYTSLDECVREALEQLEEDKQTSTENIGESPSRTAVPE